MSARHAPGLLLCLLALLTLGGCGGGAPVGEAEAHLRAGRLERAADLLAGHTDPASEALRTRIAARSAERSAALDSLAALEAAREGRTPAEVLAELERVVADAEDPVVREQAEIALSSAHDWAAEVRSRAATRATPDGRAVAVRETEVPETPAQRVGSEARALRSTDPVAAAAVRDFEAAVRAKEWRSALALASQWAEAPAAEPAVREAFAAWRRAALADAVAESDGLVVRAYRLEEEGERDAAIALLDGAAARFPLDEASVSVGRTLTELRGESPDLDLRVASEAPSLDRRAPSEPVTVRAPEPLPAKADEGKRVARATPPPLTGSERPTPTPAELEAVEAADAAAHAARRAAFAEVGERLASAESTAARDAAYAELLAAARDSRAAREVLAEALGVRMDRAVALVERAGSLRKLERVAEHRRELDAAREAALALIFDEVRYFYPYRPPHVTAEKAATYDEVQREVDRLVEAVVTVWEAAPNARIPESLRKAVPELGWLLARRSHAPERLALPASLPAWVLGLPRDLEEVSTETFAWDVDEAKLLARNRAIVERNEARWSEFDAARESGPHIPTKVEREQVRITNAYRAMLGRPLLAWHPSLHSAARGHSDYMNTTGEFGHDEVHPSTRTPFDRMRAVGYVRGISENCHMGSGDADGAHRGWMRSSGHHRNLLMTGHKEMASAMAGGYWTQNFGLDTGFEAHLDLTGWRD